MSVQLLAASPTAHSHRADRGLGMELERAVVRFVA